MNCSLGNGLYDTEMPKDSLKVYRRGKVSCINRSFFYWKLYEKIVFDLFSLPSRQGKINIWNSC